jgi:hypothetical protein
MEVDASGMVFATLGTFQSFLEFPPQFLLFGLIYTVPFNTFFSV